LRAQPMNPRIMVTSVALLRAGESSLGRCFPRHGRCDIR
jgi:hypothetical protein